MGLNLRKTLEHQPWHLSYKMALEAKPSWTRHGLPALFEEFTTLVKVNHNPHQLPHLDIGCGNGVKTVNFALQGLPTYGVDLSTDGFREGRELARELRVNRRCRFIKANCLKLPFAKNFFGSTSDILCFTHLRPSHYSRYKKELKRVLKNGGYTLMVLFSKRDRHFHGHPVSSGYSFRFRPGNPLMAGYAHYHGMYNAHFDRQDINEVFAADFQLVKVRQVKHPLYQHRRLWNIILRKLSD